MSKRLRKRIRELCGLEGLERTERRKLAQDILDSTEYKQRLCNQVPGLSYRDIERTMRNVLAENEPSREEQEEEELRRIAPQKLDPDVILGRPRREKKSAEYRTLTQEETRKLVEASRAPFKSETKEPTKPYNTWSMEEVQALLAGNYHPDNFKYLRKKNKG